MTTRTSPRQAFLRTSTREYLFVRKAREGWLTTSESIVYLLYVTEPVPRLIQGSRAEFRLLERKDVFLHHDPLLRSLECLLAREHDHDRTSEFLLEVRELCHEELKQDIVQRITN